jgi:hypothetical protein
MGRVVVVSYEAIQKRRSAGRLLDSFMLAIFGVSCKRPLMWGVNKEGGKRRGRGKEL